jgi:hypothetical protein
MTIWEALEYLNTLVDDSDPDIELPQIENLLETTKAIRRNGSPVLRGHRRAPERSRVKVSKKTTAPDQRSLEQPF